MTITSKAKVTVCVVTYNHENYIGECLDSIVTQETDFDFEIIVSDDCSTDKTPQIIQEYARKYNFIQPVIRKVNIGAGANYFDTHKLATGEFVCHCDGDDKFLPNKLQTQFDTMNNDSSLSMSVHAVKVIGRDTIIGNAPNLPVIADIKDLISLGTYFVHSSVMYRRKFRKDYPTGFDAIDFFVYIDTTFNGPIHLNKSVLGCYRKHAQGVSSNPLFKSKIEKLYGDAYELAINKGVNISIVRKAQVNKNFSFALSRCFQGDYIGSKKLVELSCRDYTYANKYHKVFHHLRRIPFFFPFIKLMYKLKNKQI